MINLAFRLFFFTIIGLIALALSLVASHLQTEQDFTSSLQMGLGLFTIADCLFIVYGVLGIIHKTIFWPTRGDLNGDDALKGGVCMIALGVFLLMFFYGFPAISSLVDFSQLPFNQ